MSENQINFLLEKIFKLGGLHEKIKHQTEHALAICFARNAWLTEKQKEILKEKFSSENLSNLVKKAFLDSFDENELLEIEKFWSSKTGKKLLTGSFFQKEVDLSVKWVVDLEEAVKDFEL